MLDAHRFDGKKALAFVLLPRGGDFEVVSAVENADSLSPWCLATLGERLPEGTYKLASGEPGKAALGWLLAQHRFDAYRSKKPEPERGPRVLVTGEAASIDQTVRLAEATALVRDLVNTPAADLGPAELEQAVARGSRTIGRARPRHHGRGSAEGISADRRRRRCRFARSRAAPHRARMGQSRAIRASRSSARASASTAAGSTSSRPRGMRIMKKDMGGAAHALALARLITAERLPVRLHLLIAAVENAVSGSAYRPGRHRQVAQGPVRRDRQHRRRGAARPRRRAHPGGRGQARADRRFRDPDRRRARRARPRPSGPVRQPRRSRGRHRAAGARSRGPALAHAACGMPTTRI